jgi:hypothetical protein
LNQGLLVDTTGVAVTTPPGVPVTVNATVLVRVKLPEVAVIVTFAVPSVAVLVAVNVAVTVLPVVAVAGLNATDTPPGSPLAAKLTAPVKFVRLIAIVTGALAPRATEVGLALPRVKSPGVVSVTVSDTEVVRVNVPEVAVNVIIAAPRVAVPDAVNVAVTELPVVEPDGLNATVTPAGKPLALIVTPPVKFVRVMAIAVDAFAPRATDNVPGEAATA